MRKKITFQNRFSTNDIKSFIKKIKDFPQRIEINIPLAKELNDDIFLLKELRGI